MRAVSVAEARRTFRALLDQVARGREVAVLRRGKEVARLTPPRARGGTLPSLAAFRASLKPKGGPLSQTVIRARREERA